MTRIQSGAGISRADASSTYAPFGAAFAGPGKQSIIKVPAPSGVTLMLPDPNHISLAGFEFFTLIDVRGKISSPLDNYYAYTGGHDDNFVFLFTAPHPEGPWTYRQRVINGFGGSYDGVGGLVHLPTPIPATAPDVIWRNGQMLLYVHVVQTVDGRPTLPTEVFTSTDGVNFTEPATVTFPCGPLASYYDTGASYCRVIDAGGYLVMVWQANTNFNAAGLLPSTSVGYATSLDGFAWNVSRAPLLANLPGERGPFNPSLFRAQGWWVLAVNHKGTVRGVSNAVHLYASQTLTPGSFRYIGPWYQGLAAPYDYPTTPSTFWAEGKMHVYFGSANSTNTVCAVFHGVVDWSM